MRYATENLARALKRAREDRSMSQSKLGKLTGIPQPHISRIESNEVDLRLSSFVLLAHALDLELMLVPRKAVAAVRSIAGSNKFRTNRGNADAMRELIRARKAVAALPKDVHQNPAAVELERQLSELGNLRNLFRGANAVRKIRLAIDAVDGSVGPDRLQGLADEVRALRYGLANDDSEDRRESGGSRPAYRLDRDDDDS